MKFAYYPGCSAESTALEYDESVKESLEYLGVDLKEIPDWSCCGATSGHALNHELALALPARNIALAEKMNLDIVTPCAGCFLRLKVAQHELQSNQGLKARIESAIEIPLQLSRTIRHVVEVFYHDAGIDRIKENVKRSLEGLKVVTYYGCYLVRPPEITEFDDPENPVIMDEVMKGLGAEVIDWSSKVDCCGGALSVTNPAIAKQLVQKIASSALEVGADAIVTACPLCQSNLDARQQKPNGMDTIPVFFFSELTTLAFRSDRVKQWCKKHLVDPSGLLGKLRLL